MDNTQPDRRKGNKSRLRLSARRKKRRGPKKQKKNQAFINEDKENIESYDVPITAQMPMTAAEKQKKYRERLRNEKPEKYEETKRKSKKRSAQYYKLKKASYSEEQKEELRRKWRESRNKAKNITEQSKNEPSTSQSTDDKQNLNQLTTNKERNIQRRIEYKLKQENVPTSFFYRVVFTARGLCPPVFTPLNEDYSVNYEVIAPYANYLAENEIKSVLVGGTTGEHMSLSVAERKKIVDEWIKVGKSIGLHIMVQVGGAPFTDVLDLAKYCAEVGVDSLLTLPELYFKPQTASELVSYVELIANAAPSLPVLYYHIPSMSKVEINMPAFVTEATIRIPNFKGIKFTSNDLSEAAQVLRCLKDGQEMFLGADTLLAPAALLGITSSIGTTFNLFPHLAQGILDAVDSADNAQARSLQEKLSLAVEAHTVEGPWVPTMKAGMEIVTGLQMGPPALPQRPLSKEAKQKIESRLRELDLIY